MTRRAAPRFFTVPARRRATVVRAALEPLERRSMLAADPLGLAVIDVLGGEASLSIVAGQTVHVKGLAGDVSADGDGDRTTGPGTEVTALYQWDFGDPALPASADPSVPAYPTPTLPPDPTPDGDPDGIPTPGASGPGYPTIPTGAIPDGAAFSTATAAPLVSAASLTTTDTTRRSITSRSGVRRGGTVTSTRSATPAATTPTTPAPALPPLVPALPAGSGVVNGASEGDGPAGTPSTPRRPSVAGTGGAGAFNGLTGWTAAHVYERPGVYTVTLNVTDQSGRTGTADVTVNVAPDDRRAIHVSALGSAAGDGATEATAVTYGRLLELLDDATPEDDARILFRRGDRFDVPASIRLSGRSNLTLGAYGDRARSRPVLYWAGGPITGAIVTMNSATRNVTLRDLVLATGVGGFEKFGTVDGVQPQGRNITVLNADFRNLNTGVNNNLAPAGVLVQGVTALGEADLRAYFVWLGGSDIVILGNTVANSTREHIVRGAAYDGVLVAGNDLTNTRSDGGDIGKGVVLFQAGKHGYATGNRLAGPVEIGPLGGSNGTPPERTEFTVVERNHVVGGTLEVVHGSYDVALRNNVVTMNASGQFEGIKIDGYVTTQNGKAYNRGTRRVSVAFNTVEMGLSTSKGIWVVPGGNANRVVGNLVTVDPAATGTGNRRALDIAGDASTGFGLIPLVADVRDNQYYAGNAVRYNGTLVGQSAWDAVLSGFGLTGGDVFRDAALDAAMRPTDPRTVFARPEAGVFTDYTGRDRPTGDGALWTVGAVEFS